MIKVVKSCEECYMADHRDDYCRLDAALEVRTLSYYGVPANCPLRKENVLLMLGENQ